MEEDYIPIPGLSDRVKALIADVFFVFAFMFIAFKIMGDPESASKNTRMIVFICIIFIYEPLFTALFGGTIGHIANNLRVKKYNNREKNISLPVAFFRFAIKYLLGAISLIAVLTNSEARAVHDIAAGSIVVYKKSDS